MENVKDMKFCQSCAMPMGTTDEMYGTEADGTKSEDYCKYCYDGGRFHGEMTMEQMIEGCIPHVLDQYKDADAAREDMKRYFPQLKRWANAQ